MRISTAVVLCASLLALSLTGLVSAQQGQAGATGAAFLKIGVGARASTLGEAYAAVADDATATYWNPAGIARIERTQVALSYSTWLQDVNRDFLAVVFPAFGGGVGISFYSLSVDGIERRTRPGQSLGSFQVNNVATGLSYGHQLGTNLTLGVTAKYIYERTFIESASGYAFDFGLKYGLSGLPFRVAAVIQNLGSMDKLREQSSKLPVLFRAGMAYELRITGLVDAVTFSGDFVKLFDSTSWAGGGVEILMQNHFLLRAGYQSGIDAKGLAAGFGVELARYHFDYGFTPFSSDLGTAQRFTFALDL